MTMFLITRGIKPADVLNLEPGATPFPESVIDMLSGGLGQPVGGWPKKLQQIVLGKRKPLKGRPGASLPPLNFKKARTELSAKIKHEASEDDLYSHLMYPEVFAGIRPLRARLQRPFRAAHRRHFFTASNRARKFRWTSRRAKPFHPAHQYRRGGRGRPAHGLVRTERHVAPDDGPRPFGQPRVKGRAKADPAVPAQVGAPIPGLITALSVGVGAKVAKGDKLLTLEAMKMQTTIYAPCDGMIQEVNVKVGDTVESKDLLVLIKE